MKTEIIQELTGNFEAHAQQTEGGVEFWLARDLQYLLGYTEWRNFNAVILKAKTACEVSGHLPGDHFVDVNKTITMPKGAEKEVPDLNGTYLSLLKEKYLPQTTARMQEVEQRRSSYQDTENTEIYIDLYMAVGRGEGAQFDFFADFNGLPDNIAKTEFYQHDAHWANQMILG